MTSRGVSCSAFAIGLLLALAGPTHAVTIGPNCASCYGATYTLTSLGLQSSTSGTQTYRFQLDVNTTGYRRNGAGNVKTDYIQGVAIKVTSNVLGVNLVLMPSGTWTLIANSGLSNGCTGAGAGFVCAETASTANKTNGATYSWVFDVTMPTGTLATGVNAASIKVNYDPPRGLIVSESVTIDSHAPEPAVWSLLVGGVGVWWWSRRNRGKTPV